MTPRKPGKPAKAAKIAKGAKPSKPAKAATPAKPAKRAVPERVSKQPARLAGGNPQISKADGEAPVQAYIRAMPGWKQDIGRRLDALIMRTVPTAAKGVRWNTPLYGIKGQGWFLGFHTFAKFVKVSFFRGTSLKPVPPGGGGDEGRWIDIHQDDLDEEQMAAWVQQAAALPGWGKSE